MSIRRASEQTKLNSTVLDIQKTEKEGKKDFLAFFKALAGRLQGLSFQRSSICESGGGVCFW